jgi:Fic family protein
MTTYGENVSPKPQKHTTSESSWRHDKPWDQLPDLPPSPPADIESKAILKQCIEARAAVAQLKQAAELIPNQAMLINTLPSLEARASSEIENIVTTNDRLFQFQQAEEHADPATKEALRYRHALLEGYKAMSKRPLSTRTAEEVCTIIKGADMRVRRVPGTTLKDSSGRVVYTPPEGERLLRNLLANWERFMHDPKAIDPLIRMAVGHYQFEAIHPFTDGNGRTGRVLNSLFLINEGLLTLPILYLSRYIIEHKSAYYRSLLEVTRDGAWEAWIMFILKGVEETARWTIAKIGAIRTLAEHTRDHVRKAAPKVYSRELIDQIFEQPYCRIQNLVDAKIAGRQAASRHLKRLVMAGVLEEKAAGRDKLFIHSKLLRLLTHEPNTFSEYR